MHFKKLQRRCKIKIKTKILIIDDHEYFIDEIKIVFKDSYRIVVDHNADEEWKK